MNGPHPTTARSHDQRTAAKTTSTSTGLSSNADQATKKKKVAKKTKEDGSTSNSHKRNVPVYTYSTLSPGPGTSSATTSTDSLHTSFGTKGIASPASSHDYLPTGSRPAYLKPEDMGSRKKALSPDNTSSSTDRKGKKKEPITSVIVPQTPQEIADAVKNAGLTGPLLAPVPTVKTSVASNHLPSNYTYSNSLAIPGSFHPSSSPSSESGGLDLARTPSANTAGSTSTSSLAGTVASAAAGSSRKARKQQGADVQGDSASQKSSTKPKKKKKQIAPDEAASTQRPTTSNRNISGAPGVTISGTVTPVAAANNLASSARAHRPAITAETSLRTQRPSAVPATRNTAQAGPPPTAPTPAAFEAAGRTPDRGIQAQVHMIGNSPAPAFTPTASSQAGSVVPNTASSSGGRADGNTPPPAWSAPLTTITLAYTPMHAYLADFDPPEPDNQADSPTTVTRDATQRSEEASNVIGGTIVPNSPPPAFRSTPPSPVESDDDWPDINASDIELLDRGYNTSETSLDLLPEVSEQDRIASARNWEAWRRKGVEMADRYKRMQEKGKGKEVVPNREETGTELPAPESTALPMEQQAATAGSSAQAASGRETPLRPRSRSPPHNVLSVPASTGSPSSSGSSSEVLPTKAPTQSTSTSAGGQQMGMKSLPSLGSVRRARLARFEAQRKDSKMLSSVMETPQLTATSVSLSPSTGSAPSLNEAPSGPRRPPERRESITSGLDRLEALLKRGGSSAKHLQIVDPARTYAQHPARSTSPAPSLDPILLSPPLSLRDEPLATEDNARSTLQHHTTAHPSSSRSDTWTLPTPVTSPPKNDKTASETASSIVGGQDHEMSARVLPQRSLSLAQRLSLEIERKKADAAQKEREARETRELAEREAHYRREAEAAALAEAETVRQAKLRAEAETKAKLEAEARAAQQEQTALRKARETEVAERAARATAEQAERERLRAIEVRKQEEAERMERERKQRQKAEDYARVQAAREAEAMRARIRAEAEDLSRAEAEAVAAAADERERMNAKRQSEDDARLAAALQRSETVKDPAPSADSLELAEIDDNNVGEVASSKRAKPAFRAHRDAAPARVSRLLAPSSVSDKQAGSGETYSKSDIAPKVDLPVMTLPTAPPRVTTDPLSTDNLRKLSRHPPKPSSMHSAASLSSSSSSSSNDDEAVPSAHGSRTSDSDSDSADGDSTARPPASSLLSNRAGAPQPSSLGSQSYHSVAEREAAAASWKRSQDGRRASAILSRPLSIKRKPPPVPPKRWGGIWDRDSVQDRLLKGYKLFDEAVEGAAELSRNFLENRVMPGSLPGVQEEEPAWETVGRDDTIAQETSSRQPDWPVYGQERSVPPARLPAQQQSTYRYPPQTIDPSAPLTTSRVRNQVLALERRLPPPPLPLATNSAHPPTTTSNVRPSQTAQAINSHPEHDDPFSFYMPAERRPSAPPITHGQLPGSGLQRSGATRRLSSMAQPSPRIRHGPGPPETGPSSPSQYLSEEIRATLNSRPRHVYSASLPNNSLSSATSSPSSTRSRRPLPQPPVEDAWPNERMRDQTPIPASLSLPNSPSRRRPAGPATAPLDQPLAKEVTDLDMMLSRLDEGPPPPEATHVLNEMLGLTRPATAEEIDSLPVGRVELERRRTDKNGKVKQKLACVGINCNKCNICSTQFKEDELACVLPLCLHVFHAEPCVRSYLSANHLCPTCQTPLM